jgi:drug/metabolite transporter (DMT)-like permease
MIDLTLGIVAGLGSGLTWASSSILVRSLSGSYGVAGVNALRSLVGGGLLLAIAFATGHGPEIMQAPLWAVLSLCTSIVIALACLKNRTCCD